MPKGNGICEGCGIDGIGQCRFCAECLRKNNARACRKWREKYGLGKRSLKIAEKFVLLRDYKKVGAIFGIKPDTVAFYVWMANKAKIANGDPSILNRQKLLCKRCKKKGVEGKFRFCEDCIKLNIKDHQRAAHK